MDVNLVLAIQAVGEIVSALADMIRRIQAGMESGLGREEVEELFRETARLRSVLAHRIMELENAERNNQ